MSDDIHAKWSEAVAKLQRDIGERPEVYLGAILANIADRLILATDKPSVQLCEHAALQCAEWYRNTGKRPQNFDNLLEVIQLIEKTTAEEAIMVLSGVLDKE